jgi:hypothetical protein
LELLAGLLGVKVVVVLHGLNFFKVDSCLARALLHDLGGHLSI